MTKKYVIIVMHKLYDFGDCKVRNLNILLHIVLIVKLTYTISSNKKI